MKNIVRKYRFKNRFFVILFILIMLVLFGITNITNIALEVFAAEEEPENIVIRTPNSVKEMTVEEIIDLGIPTAREILIPNSKKREECLEVLAKTVYGEAGGIESKSERAAVIWCVLNRCKEPTYTQVIKQATKPSQFDGYKKNYPVKKWAYNLANDVLTRWELENMYGISVGRVLPKDYKYFMGDGVKNYFCKEWHRSSLEYAKNNAWDFSLDSPY